MSLTIFLGVKRKLRKLVIFSFYVIFILVIILKIIFVFQMRGILNYHDWWFYREALTRYHREEPLYQLGFIYFPSFFYLEPFMRTIRTMFYFLFFSTLVSLGFLLYNEEKPYNAFLFFFYVLFAGGVFIGGNINPFIFLCVVACCTFKDNVIVPPCILAFISFKPTVILIIPVFIYFARSRILFGSLYGSFFLLFNSYLITEPEIFFQLVNSGISDGYISGMLGDGGWQFYSYYYMVNSRYS